MPGLECRIMASPALRIIGRSHCAGDVTYNNGRPRLRRRSTARLEQSAGRDPSQSISGCLQTFTENSLLYPEFLLTLFLFRAPLTLWSVLDVIFFIYDTLILTILHYTTKNLLELWSVCEIPLHDTHVSTATEQARATKTQRLDAVWVIRLQATTWVDNTGTVRRYSEHLQDTDTYTYIHTYTNTYNACSVKDKACIWGASSC